MTERERSMCVQDSLKCTFVSVPANNFGPSIPQSIEVGSFKVAQDSLSSWPTSFLEWSYRNALPLPSSLLPGGSRV